MTDLYIKNIIMTRVRRTSKYDVANEIKEFKNNHTLTTLVKIILSPIDCSVLLIPRTYHHNISCHRSFLFYIIPSRKKKKKMGLDRPLFFSYFQLIFSILNLLRVFVPVSFRFSPPTPVRDGEKRAEKYKIPSSKSHNIIQFTLLNSYRI